jgi:hypothetical protein
MDNTISLIGFDILDNLEQDKVKEIVTKNLKKINIRGDYSKLRIELKQHQHTKEIIHELKLALFMGNKRIGSQASDKNLYRALQTIFDKTLSELEHKDKPKKQHIIGRQKIENDD